LEADGVHSGYEDDMVNYGYVSKKLTSLLTNEIQRQESNPKEQIDTISTGREAGIAIIRLIGRTHETIDPQEIVDKWVELHGASKSDRNEEMWETFGTRTVTCMARARAALHASGRAPGASVTATQRSAAGQDRTNQTS
jgi:hypothetical protein